MLLNGLVNFYNELRLDNNSFLHEYYKKNKYLLTDEEDDEELDNEDNKNIENFNSKIRSSKTFVLNEESKIIESRNTGSELKRASTMNIDINKPTASNTNSIVENKKSAGKKPELPANINESFKSYYDTVEKIIYYLLKIYELNENNGWTLIETKEDCTVHTKIDSETGLTISRGETVIEKDRESVNFYKINKSCK